MKDGSITAGLLKWNAREKAKSNLEKLKKIEEGTYEYDGSMPKSCVDAMYKKKVEQDKEVLAYLSGFPDDFVMYTREGYGKEYAGYLAIVNK